ncbi:PAS domain S-box protein [Tepidimonas taiwanensis]|uniref:histidine kinase n=3 Tax=Tepidimonas taiwanensis TaxID=307486 RepID=A0A554X983_9BURK|nr:PAS domain-containing sensor histidine kinase [Tepidimonas taiwanensis]MDM7463021.1 PAS domain S-box protein [Tepidimonas taiwanensis]TSE32404.1 Sensor protein FixL [Tepidimonas taiwanensis]UBQ06581.1 PAS domain S-box protein [Tepidimonas taiwanensis]
MTHPESTPNGHRPPAARSGWRWPLQRWRAWWDRLPPATQDRLAVLGPVVSVVLFLAAILSALVYFTEQVASQEQEAVIRDTEYAQQRLRLRLLERQEQLMRLARDIANRTLEETAFVFQAEALVLQNPELLSVHWVGPYREVVTGYTSPSAPVHSQRLAGQPLTTEDTGGAFELARDLHQPVYSRPLRWNDSGATLLLLVPFEDQRRFGGVVMAEYSVEGLLRYGVPPEVLARYAVTLVGEDGTLYAGTPLKPLQTPLSRLPWSARPQRHELPITPIGNSLLVRAEGLRADRDVGSEALFWLVGAMSVATIWMLLGNMRHTRRRLQAQRALVAETNFRRAMENSMLTGMRALDMEGRITYVNRAFCDMTGWSESELIGARPPFPYWPESEHDTLMARLHDEIAGRNAPGGFEVPVKRKNGSIFYARMYVSPLIDAQGRQTGWMTSMTDITEPKRIREELTASYDRFATVLDSLDEAISVAPLHSHELLFANRMYRNWFGDGPHGHERLLELCAAVPVMPAPEENDQVDALAGLPADALIEAVAEHAQIHVPELGKWLELRTRYLTWVDGRLVQMLIATDITARLHAEEQAKLQAERAAAASRLITMGEMASSVAHELNQPLTAISNYANGLISRLRAGRTDHDEMLAALEKTARQAQRAGSIIQRIRAFVKKSEPNPTLSDVGQMVANAVELANIELKRHLVRLNVYQAERLPALLVDPILIEQVLINLLKNAGESIQCAQRPPRQRLVELTVTPRRLDGRDGVEFIVRDNGCGIPPERLERIYEAFYSTKAEGMGIGLKLCRSIIESHHGRLQARNLYNGGEVAGCEFTFWLPVPHTDSRGTPAAHVNETQTSEAS